jgi:hypothetical protein
MMEPSDQLLTQGVFFDDLDRELCTGAIDMHVHLAPSIFARKDTEIGFARLAKAAGFRAAVSKSHATLNADRTGVVRELTGFDLFGSVVLNQYVGGINPHAVEAAITYGARVVWMPTMHAAAHVARHGQPVYSRLTRTKGRGSRAAKHPTPITVLNENGGLREPVVEVLELIADANIVLATGHLGYEECKVLVPEARRMGVKRIVVTHVELEVPQLSIAQQKELADAGAYIEHIPMPLLPTHERLDPKALIAAIEAVGAERCVLSTDHGTAYAAHPVEGMRWFLRLLHHLGVKMTDIDRMVKQNPRELLDLS